MPKREWLAGLWWQVDPRRWNLNTFHFERTAPWFPSIEAIFESAQPNTAVSYDSHPQDTAMHDPFLRSHMLLLNILARTVAYHAFVQGQRPEAHGIVPLMLWAGGNRWSLNFMPGEGPAGHGTVADAVQCAYDVVRESQRMGGRVAALLGWHFDIPHQRLPEEMQQQAFRAVSTAMRAMQPTLSQTEARPTPPGTVLSYDERRMLTEVGWRGTFDLYDRYLLPALIRRHGLALEALADEAVVVLPLGGTAYQRAMSASSGVREYQLF